MIDVNSLKVTELKAELTARGLPTKGLKKELVTRLEEALAAEGTTSAPTESSSEPEVAAKEPKDVEPPQRDSEDQKMEAAVQEAQEIAEVVRPVAEPVAAAAETDIVMDAVPVPAIKDEATLPVSSSESAAVLEPIVGTPTLLQEGLVDTTMFSETVDSTVSKKRSLENDQAPPTSTTSIGRDSPTTPTAPAKRLKALINREESDKIAVAAKESVEADALRRSAAPSPSPVPARTSSVSSIAPVIEEGSPASSSNTSSEPLSPLDGLKSGTGGVGRRLDMRSVMERQIKLAALDRKPDSSTLKSGTASSTVTKPASTVESSTDTTLEPAADIPADAPRALVITNFVRPLTVNQVKRMLSEFGEVEFNEASAAAKAYTQVKGQVFPKETGKPLEPHFITAEAATQSIQAAEEAQRNGKKPVIFKGGVISPKRGAPITLRKDDAEVIFRRDKVEIAQVVQPADLFKMTTTQPALYYKPVKEAPILATLAENTTPTTTLDATEKEFASAPDVEAK
ncbi:hypothetical protein EDD11_001336 [Mortierella claussenii]|nr:hypothetical protein EDD11_001336 [Mortierella claussenii]